MNTRRSDENASTKKDEKLSQAEPIDDDLRTWLKESLKKVETNMISHLDINYKTLTAKVDKNLEETTKILNIATEQSKI